MGLYTIATLFPSDILVPKEMQMRVSKPFKAAIPVSFTLLLEICNSSKFTSPAIHQTKKMPQTDLFSTKSRATTTISIFLKVLEAKFELR
jgi:hypothetical protein